MVLQGVEVPESNDTNRALKALAKAVIAIGPPPLSPEDERKLRYGITDLIDDIRSPRSHEELIGSGARLFEALANYHLRANGLWSAKGKSIPGALGRANPDLSGRYCRVFDGLFKKGETGPVVALAEELLVPQGGLLFEGYRLDAPPEWRKLRP
jgi:hypothetical protein